MKEIPAAGTIARFAHAYSKNRYAIVFYSILATMAASPLLSAFSLDLSLIEVFLAANLFTAMLPASPGSGRHLLFSGLIAVCSLHLGAIWLQNAVLSMTSLGLLTLFALLAVAGAIRFAVRATRVDREHLYAALDAYLLFGIFSGVLYWTIEQASPNSLLANGRAAENVLSLSRCIYFSFVTLVTLGYGDIVPNSEATRGLAIVEALTGQLYLTVMIAYLVGLNLRESTPDGP